MNSPTQFMKFKKNDMLRATHGLCDIDFMRFFQ